MKTILVPCDFSKTAIHAFQFALDIAEKSKGKIHLIHAIELPVMHDSMLMPVLSFEAQLLEDLKTRAETEFGKLKKKFANDQVTISTKVEFGSPSNVISKYSQENKIDLIVMGSHGASGLREYFIGSNAEKIVRRAKVPVLVTKEYYKGPIKNIVFPNTLETVDQEDLVMHVKALQNFFDATLHIVWINTPVNFTNDTITFNRLRAFEKRFMLKNCKIHVFNHMDPDEGIRDFSNSIQADMIAIGTHGRKGISHFLLGSLAESIVNHSKGLIWTYAMKNDTSEA